MTITRNSPGVYDTTTGKAAPAANADQFEGWARPGSYRDSVVDGKQILMGDRQVTFIPDERDYSSPSFVPKVGDIALFDDTTDGAFSVISFKIRELGGELICYTLQVRNDGG